MIAFDAIVPAGGTIDDAFAAEVGTPYKALVRFGDATLLQLILGAIRETGRVKRILVIGPKAVQEHARPLADVVLDEGTSGPDNILRGIVYLRENTAGSLGKVLVVTSDLPFLTGDTLNRFVDSCRSDMDFSVPLIGRPAFEAAFPGAPATFVPLREGSVTTGCAYYVDADVLERGRAHIEAVFQNRKSKFGMAKLLGLPFVWKFLTKSLRLPDIEHKASQLLGCRGAAVPDSPPELAFDIDYVDDYRYARSRMGL
ncbi:MAG: nucleotidyltransferase family protein [Fimbriimonadaceae bacterium]|nr:nucleotidyltransferase family protein [Fimbriimonadaceae bacterium]